MTSGTEGPDTELVELLDSIRGKASALLRAQEAGSAFQTAETTAALDQMRNQVRDAMGRHSEFADVSSRFFLGKQLLLQPWTQSQNLLRVAVERGGQGALAWYRKVKATDRANLRVISEVHGLLVEEPIRLSNGVELVPLDRLQESYHANRLRAVQGLHIEHPAAAVFLVEGVPCTSEIENSHAEYLRAIEGIRRGVVAFTLSEDAAPTTGISWTEFEDPDLAAALFGIMWQTPTYDGRQPQWPVPVTADMISSAEKFLALTGKVAKVCEVGLTRLNLARRRMTPGDQAIDGAVSLEAVLSDGQSGDLTYKLRLRTALLLGTTLEERRAVGALVVKFYRLRGKVVHGQSSGTSVEDTAVAKDGLHLCRSVLTAVVDAAALPDLERLELMGEAWAATP